MKACNIIYPYKKATHVHNTLGENLLPQKSKVVKVIF